MDANGKVVTPAQRASLTNMTRRRSHLEMLVCALLVAALAVQPAAGDGKRKDTRAPAAAAVTRAKQANLLAQAKATTHLATTARAAQVGAPPAAPADPATTPPPPAPSPPAEQTPAPSPPAATGGNPPVDRVPAAAPEQGAPGGAPALALARPAPAEAPAPATDATAEASVGGRVLATAPDPATATATASDTARGATSGGPPQSAGPAAETAPPNTALVAPPATATPGAPDTQEVGTGRVAVPDERSGSTLLRGGTSRRGANATTRTPDGSARRRGTSAASQSRTAISISGLDSSLATPATEAITRVRSGDPSATSQPLPSADGTVPPLQGPARSGAGNSSVAEVLVSWAKYALAGLGLLVIVLGANAILAAVRTRRLERQRERLMEDIGLLQAALLPAVPARLGALLTTVAYRPADGPAAGGDFYDAFALPDGRVGLLLGDVSGHGRQALAKTTLVRFTVRAHLEAGLSPREAIAISGRSLDGRLTDDFATVIAAIHDPVKGTLTYASAGHPPPIVVGPPSHRPVTVSSAPPIGVGFPTGQRQTVLPMPEGASVMIYSDGLLEARVDGVPLGPERLAAWLRELGPDATARAVLDRVVEHADRVPDDLAAVLLHAAPGANAPAARIEELKLDVLDMDGPDLDGFLRAAGVSDVDRLVAGRRVSELLGTTSGVIVEVRTGEHPMVGVTPIGDDYGLATRPSARTR
jgi:serine phosphatase RsbU (regulator of sigma subunit)